MMVLDTQLDLSELGIMIRQRRLEAGWNQAEMAKRTGLSQGGISTFERYGGGLTLAALARLLKTLGLRLVVCDQSEVDHG